MERDSISGGIEDQEMQLPFSKHSSLELRSLFMTVKAEGYTLVRTWHHPRNLISSAALKIGFGDLGFVGVLCPRKGE